jgi:adenylate kinase family enzyme
MQRIFITGNAGSGKTTLAKALSKQLQLPYVGLDSIVWRPGWAKTPMSERNTQEKVVAADSAWIVDGVSDIILEAADLVIFLDCPRHKCYWRVFWRNLPYLFRSRPGLPARCPEILIVRRLLKIIWHFPKLVRPKVLSAVRKKGNAFIHVRSNEELQKLVRNIGAVKQW